MITTTCWMLWMPSIGAASAPALAPRQTSRIAAKMARRAPPSDRSPDRPVILSIRRPPVGSLNGAPPPRCPSVRVRAHRPAHGLYAHSGANPQDAWIVGVDGVGGSG